MGFENNVVISLTAEEADAVSAWRKVRREGPEAMDRELKRVKATTKETDAALKDMGMKGVGTFKNLATGVATFISSVMSAQAVLRGTSTILQRMRDDDKRASESVKSSTGGLAELAQLANNRKELKALQDRAREMFRSGAAGSLDEAARMVFDIESAGQSKDESLFKDISRYRLASDSGQMALATSQIQKAFGEKVAGESTKVVSELFGASAPSPSKTTELSAAVARAAPGAALLGFSPQETMAATSIVSQVVGVEEAGTQMASFNRSVMKDASRFRGKSIMETVENVEKAGLSEERLLDLFGRHEAVNAYLLMAKNKDAIRALEADTLKAGQEQRVKNKIALSAGSPGVQETLGLKAAEAREAESIEQRGNVVLTADAIQRQISARLRERGQRHKAAAFDAMSDLVRFIPGGEDAFLRETTRSLGVGPFGVGQQELEASPTLRGIVQKKLDSDPANDAIGDAEWRQALMEMSESMKRIEENTRPDKQKPGKVEVGPAVKRERVPNP